MSNKYKSSSFIYSLLTYTGLGVVVTAALPLLYEHPVRWFTMMFAGVAITTFGQLAGIHKLAETLVNQSDEEP